MLPQHDEFSRLRRGYEFSCIVAAVGLLVVQGVRVLRSGSDSPWWLTVLTLAAGAVTADFVSGLVHWLADTWGSETMPLLGRRLLRPFRVHHVNPDDFLRRQFLDTNGDVALIVAVVLLAAIWVPLDTLPGRTFAQFLVAFCVVGLPTNQVHQWAHMPAPPRAVRWLQDWGIILNRDSHREHHRAPYAMNYCIATGWCNPVLNQVDFFRRSEAVVTALTGWHPRADDTEFQRQVADQAAPGAVDHA